MRGWMLLATVGCGGLPGTTTTGDTGAPDSGTTGLPGGCVFDLGLWCFNSEGDGGPGTNTGTCPVPTVADALAEPGGFAAPIRGQCTDPTHGVLEFVNVPTGYGGPTWFFDDTGAFVAYTYGTDINVFCDETAFSVSYGFEPDCEDRCWLEDPDGVSGLPPC